VPQLPHPENLTWDDTLATNRASWDERAAAHVDSPGYGVTRFATDPQHLSEVVRFDLPLLGDISGLRGVHLQCHIGSDTASLARLGATMAGLDLSGEAIRQAAKVAELAGVELELVQGDVYEAVDLLGAGRFDLVFTGIGALCWLPDVHRWAQLVADLLAPGGRLFLREGHPMLWSVDDETSDRLVLRFPYFETPEPVVWEDDSTYVETDVVFTQNVTHSWNHGLGEIVQAVLDAGLTLTGLVEHRSVPWEALPGQMAKGELDEWRLTKGGDRLPLSYTLQATKPA